MAAATVRRGGLLLILFFLALPPSNLIGRWGPGGCSSVELPRLVSTASAQAPASSTALLRVTLPADAKLTIDGNLMKQTGPVRLVRTPPISPGQDYSYILTAEVTRGGQVLQQSYKVIFQAGQEVPVEFSMGFRGNNIPQTAAAGAPGAPPAASAATEYPLSLARMGIRLPRSPDHTLDSILSDPRTFFYKLPPAYQAHYVLDGRKVFGIFKPEFLSDFNANLDFPWTGTLGLDHAMKRKDNPYGVVNFLHLPNGAPILLIENEFPQKWLFPDGAVAGEVIYVKHRGRNYVQEIRTRTKDDGSIRWTPGIFRPVATREEFLRLTGGFYRPTAKHFFLRNPEEDEVMKIEGLVEKLPPLGENEVAALLSMPFKNVTRTAWSETSSAPTSEQDFHIVPKDYSLGAIKPTALRCMECHRQTQISIGNLIPKEPSIARNPLKHGRIRGSDGIFSWHPWDPASIRSSDKEAAPLRYREYDQRLGIVRRLEPWMIKDGVAQIGQNKYRLTKVVEDSLKGHELPYEDVMLHGGKRKPVITEETPPGKRFGKPPGF